MEDDKAIIVTSATGPSHPSPFRTQMQVSPILLDMGEAFPVPCVKLDSESAVGEQRAGTLSKNVS